MVMEEIDGFSALMEREYASMLRVATVIVGDEGMAREIVQEAFTRALLRWRCSSKPGRGADRFLSPKEKIHDPRRADVTRQALPE